MWHISPQNEENLSSNSSSGGSTDQWLRDEWIWCLNTLLVEILKWLTLGWCFMKDKASEIARVLRT